MVPGQRREQRSGDRAVAEEQVISLAQEVDRARKRVADAPDDQEAARALGAVVRAQGAAAMRPKDMTKPISAAVLTAADELRAGQMEHAERRLRQHLRAYPRDTSAMRLMAHIALCCGVPEDAEKILRKAQEYAPDEPENVLALVGVLRRQSRMQEAIKAIETMAAGQSDVRARILHGSLLLLMSRTTEAEEIFGALVRDAPTEPAAWINFGYLSATMGRLGEAAAAYRTAVALNPKLGSGWIGLANLKLIRLYRDDIDDMRRALDDAALPDEARTQLLFALATALDQNDCVEEAFSTFSAANALHRRSFHYDDAEFAKQAQRLLKRLDRPFFEERQGWGCARPGPIFVLGMTRSGSTLVEQILASHPAVEGTDELKILHELATKTAAGATEGHLAGALWRLSMKDASALGAEYLERAKSWRRTDRPFFTDKMPANWIYVGLIRLILPSAKIIDIRRHPLDCCWSNFTQFIQHGMAHTCDLDELGRYYRRYVSTMAHFDDVLPGFVHRIHYEDLVSNPDNEVRRLLAFLELPSEPACLAFHKTERAIFTPSAQQVRKPINRNGLSRWRPYEPWLGPLKKALGDVLEFYPQVPRR